MPANASTEWRTGWRDGCDSGRAAAGSERYQYNYSLLGTPKYREGWQGGFTTCKGASEKKQG